MDCMGSLDYRRQAEGKLVKAFGIFEAALRKSEGRCKKYRIQSSKGATFVTFSPFQSTGPLQPCVLIRSTFVKARVFRPLLTHEHIVIL